PQTGVRDRWVTRVRLTFDTGAPVTVDLGPQSLTPQGQVVHFLTRTVRILEVESLAVSAPPGGELTGANPVGIAEVRLGDAQVTETVRLPVDLAARVGSAAAGHRLDVVLSRLRTDPAERGRQDEELSISRRLVLPDARSFALSGTVRVDPNAPDGAIDAVLGTTAPGTSFLASGHLGGDANARASRAFDGDPSTAWSAPIGPQEGQWIEADLSTAETVDHLTLTVVADGRHSVPTKLRLEADGVPVRELTVPPVTDGSQNGATQQVTVPFAPVTGAHLRLVVEAARAVTTIDDQTHQAVTLPVAIAETGLPGIPAPAAAGSVPSACRSDLLRVDGHA